MSASWSTENVATHEQVADENPPSAVEKDSREKGTVTTHHWDRQNAFCGVSRRGSRLSLGDHDLTSVTVPDRIAPEPKTPKHQHSLNPSTTSLNDTQSRGRPSTIKADSHTPGKRTSDP